MMQINACSVWQKPKLKFVTQIQFLTLTLKFLNKTDDNVMHSAVRGMPSPWQAYHLTPPASLNCTTPNHVHHAEVVVSTRIQLQSLAQSAIFRQIAWSGTELCARQGRNTAVCRICAGGFVLFHDKWWNAFRLPISSWPQPLASIANTTPHTY